MNLVLLSSYMSDRIFRVEHRTENSEFKEWTGVLYESVLSPILYLIFVRDIPVDRKTKIATHADDTAIMTIGNFEKIIKISSFFFI